MTRRRRPGRWPARVRAALDLLVTAGVYLRIVPARHTKDWP